LDAGTQRGLQDGQRDKPDAARCASSCAVGDRYAELAFADCGPARESRLEDRDVLDGRPLLRRIDRGRTGRPEQWVVDVAGDHEAGLAHPRMQRAQIDPVEVAKRLAAGSKLIASAVQEADAGRARQTSGSV